MLMGYHGDAIWAAPFVMPFVSCTSCIGIPIDERGQRKLNISCTGIPVDERGQRKLNISFILLLLFCGLLLITRLQNSVNNLTFDPDWDR